MIVQTINTSGCCPQTIVIGRRGTYDTIQIAFDLSYLVESYGNGVAVLAVKRSQDESAYPAIVTQEDATLLWIVNETDTAYVGSGECQLMWYVDGGLAKTIIYPMVVMRDILQTAEQPPDGYENWIEHLTELGAETQQNAQNAAQSASDAEQSATDAGAAKDAANEAVLHYPKIENGYWYVWDVTAQAYQNTNIKAEGDDGYSPEVTITSIEGGHRITITDEDHPQGQTFDVMDGQGGSTGDYDELSNKPQINGHTLDGNQSASNLGLGTYSKPASGIPKTDLADDVQQSLRKAETALQSAPVQSVAGKTGAVTLGAGDVGFDEAETYQSGTAGHKLSELSRQLSDLQYGNYYEAQSVNVNKSINTSSGVNIIPSSITTESGFCCLCIPCVQDDRFIISGLGGSQTRLWAFADSDGNAIEQASANESATGKELTAPTNSAYFAFNSRTNVSYSVYKEQKISDKADKTTYQNVSGTTLTLAPAVDNTMYLCGELAELTVTAPATGIFAVRFASGSTPTVATFTGVTWLNGFTPLRLEANKTYEINILNGLGCAAWT